MGGCEKRMMLLKPLPKASGDRHRAIERRIQVSMWIISIPLGAFLGYLIWAA